LLNRIEPESCFHLGGTLAAEPRFLSPALAPAFLQTEQPTLTPELPRDLSCFRLLLPKGTLYGEEGPESRSVVVAEVRAMEGWLPDNFELAGGGLACIGLGEDGSTYLASNVLDPSTKAQQPAHTDFSPTLWDWDADGVKGTSSRMEQLCVHALLVQLYAKSLVSEGEIPSPINPPSGCRFRTRCWLREQLGNPERCATEEPLLAASPRALDVAVACHFPLEDGAASTTESGRTAAAATAKAKSTS
jgi:hypothetical protein